MLTLLPQDYTKKGTYLCIWSLKIFPKPLNSRRQMTMVTWAQPECFDAKFKALHMVGFGGGFLGISTIVAFFHILELSKSSKRLKKKTKKHQ